MFVLLGVHWETYLKLKQIVLYYLLFCTSTLFLCNFTIATQFWPFIFFMESKNVFIWLSWTLLFNNEIKVKFPFPKKFIIHQQKRCHRGQIGIRKSTFLLYPIAGDYGFCAPPSRALCGWDQEVIQFLISYYFYQVKCDRLGDKSGAADAHLHMKWFYCARASDIKLLSRLLRRLVCALILFFKTLHTLLTVASGNNA